MLPMPRSPPKISGDHTLAANDTRVSSPAYWLAMINAHRTKNLAAELLKAEAWCVANPSRSPKKQAGRFLNSWFERASEEDE